MHNEIDTIVQKIKSEIEVIELKNMAVLTERETKISRIMSEIKQDITNLKKLLKSNDSCIVSTYKSRNAEFKILPRKINISLPNFVPKTLNKEKLHQQFGKLSDVSTLTEEPGHTSRNLSKQTTT